jgi:hypothetical protein
MHRGQGRTDPRSYTRTIYLAVYGFLFLGIVLWFWWQFAGNFNPLQLHFTLIGAGFLIGMAARESFLALTAMSGFENQELLHRTWLLMALSAICRLTGWTLQHAVAPLFNERDDGRWRTVGATIAGPIALLLMSAGLLRVLRGYRQLGYPHRLRWIDYVAIAGVMGYVLYTGAIVLRMVAAGTKPVQLLPAINWVTDPVLCMLLIISIVLRRSVVGMGGGLVARCWTAYMAAILLTTAGDISQWAVAYGYISWPWTSLTWFIWYPAAAAYALGAAYQVDAMNRSVA